MKNHPIEQRRPFLEPYGESLVTVTRLWVLAFVLGAFSLGSLGLAAWAFVWAQSQKPLIVRIDEAGQAKVIDYKSFDYTPGEADLRHFLAQFVYLHFRRMVSSVEKDFSKSLYFVDKKLSQYLVEEERKTQSIAKFVREGADEVDVVIKNIALLDLRSTPMKATVDFERVILSRGDRREISRERNAGYFEFVVQETVPNWMVLENPLGLTITYFRLNTAFK